MRVALLLAIATATAVAAPALDPAKKEEATRLVNDASARFERKDYQGALDAFDAAYRIYPTPKLHYNRALALDALHRTAQAADEFQRFLAEARDAPAEARTEAARALAELERGLGMLALKSSVPAEATIDGIDVGATPVALHVAVGSHAVHVTAPGRRPWDTTVALEASEHVQLVIDLPEVDLRPVIHETPIVVEPVRPSEPSPSIVRRPWFWGTVAAVVIGGIAVALVATHGSSSPPATELGTFMPKL